MKLTNVEILNINSALSELFNVKVSGKLKFKLYKTKVEIEKLIEPISLSLSDIKDDNENAEQERLDILNSKQEVNIDNFTEEELLPLDLSISQLARLDKIISWENDEDEIFNDNKNQ